MRVDGDRRDGVDCSRVSDWPASVVRYGPSGPPSQRASGLAGAGGEPGDPSVHHRGPRRTIEFESLARGIKWRAVYAPEALQSADRVAPMQALQRAGERGRIAPGLQPKLAIADSRLALLPLTPDHDERETAILVHPVLPTHHCDHLIRAVLGRGMLAFGSDQAMPAELGQAHPTDPALLLLLAAGATDEAIARQLSISLRIARRRLAQLMRSNGIQTRFQLGLVAGRQGWAEDAGGP